MCRPFTCVKCNETKINNCGGPSVFMRFEYGGDLLSICNACIYSRLKNDDDVFAELIQRNVINKDMVIKYYFADDFDD